MMFRVFISSVQREFANERRALAEYIRRDAILGRFFEVFVFEDVAAQDRSASGVYLSEVDRCDIYLGLHGSDYGNVDAKGVSATEREYERAEKKRKTRICLLKRVEVADMRQKKFIARITADVIRKGFASYDELRTSVYAALAKFLESKNLINALPFDAAATARLQLKDLSIAKIRSFLKKAREIRRWNVPANAKPMEVLHALDLIGENGEILNPAGLLFGTGSRDVVALCEEAGLPRPRWFLDDGDDFRIVIKRPDTLAPQRSRTSAPDKLSDKLPDKLPDNCRGGGETTERVLSFVEKHPGCNRLQIAKAIGQSVESIKLALAQLRAAPSRVEHRGSKKTGGYYSKDCAK